MTSPVRVEYEGASYHVTARGNGHQRVFKDDADCRLFVQTLGEALGEFGLELIAWILMPNHYHLILRTPRGNLSRSMRWFHTTFTVRYNRRHQRVGHLFQGRYQARVVEGAKDAARLLAYVHLNPVRRHRAGKVVLVGCPEDLDRYGWSSHPDYVGKRKASPLPLSWDWLIGAGGTKRQARRTYRRQIARMWTLGQTRSPWNDLAGGLVLGSKGLEEKVRRKLNQRSAVGSQQWVADRTQTEVQQEMKRALRGESDRRLRCWARVRLAGERLVDVAREEGFADGSGVLHAVQRLEARAAKDTALQKRLEQLRQLSSFKS